ncbi:hypothetical protein OG936_23150 [Streptomyces sp. NBC_00846]|uniref:hypothetical protein n=1 Tax=Streptomyces sp. NBC_00846 TaxID=2975849 RepID=UPI0038677465|nr:hypothetical protein OG936_23150 [Streptomyces sp. NBC_00846]
MSDADATEAERTSSIPRPASPAPSGASDKADTASAAEARPGSARAEPAAEKPAREKSGSDWFAPRKTPTNTSVVGSGAPGGADGPKAAAPTPPRADLPYFSDGPQRTGEQDVPRPGSALDELSPRTSGDPRPTPNLGVRTPGPSGPTTGVTGTSALTPNLDRAGGFDTAGPGGSSGPQGQGPGAPGGVPGRMSDDTAVLTPQPPAPAPAGRGGNVSGDTLTSGIPVVPPEHRSPFPPPSPFAGAGGPGGGRPDLTPGLADDAMGTGPAVPGGPATPSPGPAARPAPPTPPAKKKGRSKLVLLCAGVVGLLGVAYGAGLLMNHSDVPKGTTVLGVDIGGGTKEEGVAKLDTFLGKRAQAPLQLSVDGKKTELAPDKAGLGLDSQETVRSAAGSDYNPISVIGSLFGSKRVVDPVIPVDEEKLGVALTDLAGVSGSANDGTIRFEPGKAVAVPGKAGKALDVNQSLISVRDAYRAQVETGRTATVQLPLTSREPTISQAELDRAMKEFAQPAMSGLITIKAGPKQIQFGPAKSLPKILTMVPVNGRLVEHYDKKAIDTLCEGVFDGIMVTKGDGKKHQLGADDVAAAMQTALVGKNPVARTVTIDLGGNG